MASRLRNQRLPPEVNQILYVRNLPFKITAEELFDIFGKYGAIRQIRMGITGNKETRGTAFVIYEDIYDAKTAQEHLSGFNVCGRYLVVLFYTKKKHGPKEETGSMSTEVKVSRLRQETDNLRQRVQLYADANDSAK